jgi:hypothetical protein
MLEHKITTLHNYNLNADTITSVDFVCGTIDLRIKIDLDYSYKIDDDGIEEKYDEETCATTAVIEVQDVNYDGKCDKNVVTEEIENINNADFVEDCFEDFLEEDYCLESGDVEVSFLEFIKDIVSENLNNKLKQIKGE